MTEFLQELMELCDKYDMSICESCGGLDFTSEKVDTSGYIIEAVDGESCSQWDGPDILNKKKN